MALKRWPGLIDVHVHLRDPGATYKEDFKTGSRAAVKGGFTYVVDMPNNPQPTVTLARLKQKVKLADKKAAGGVGFYFGSNGKNISQLAQAWRHKRVFGLKLYCNHTTGEMLIDDIHLLEKVFSGWRSSKPILVHAEGRQLAAVIGLARLYNRRLHGCHISQAIEVELVRQAKKKGQAITAGVCPHHLFMTGEARKKLKGYAVMRPPLETKKDQVGLWQGLLDGTIDLVETDHAPHTKEEKARKQPAFGVPGLETALGLMLKAVKDKKVSLKQVKQWLYVKPKKIFQIPDQKQTYIEFDPDKPYVLKAEGLETKCGWSPFIGWQLYGQVKKAVIKGKVVLENYEFKN